MEDRPVDLENPELQDGSRQIESASVMTVEAALALLDTLLAP